MTLKTMEKLVLKENCQSGPVHIIWEYAIIKQKLEDPNMQSWYFKKSIANYEQQLIKFSNDFDRIRTLFNKTTLDDLIHNIHLNNIKLNNYNKNGMNAIVKMSMNLLRQKNKLNSELIGLKSKISSIHPIEYYA